MIEFPIPCTPCAPLRPGPAAAPIAGPRPTDHVRPLPASVIERGAEESCHGARTS